MRLWSFRIFVVTPLVIVCAPFLITGAVADSVVNWLNDVDYRLIQRGRP